MIPEIRLLAAKTSRENDNLWLPLLDHLKDTAGVIEYLSSRWLPGSVYDELEISRKEGIRLAKLLALLHDIGKGIPAFQTRIMEQLPDIRCFQESAGIETNLNRTQMDIKHAHAGAVLLRAMGYPESVAAIVGAHHGSPEPNNMDDDAFDELTLERKKYGDKRGTFEMGIRRGGLFGKGRDSRYFRSGSDDFLRPFDYGRLDCKQQLLFSFAFCNR